MIFFAASHMIKDRKPPYFLPKRGRFPVELTPQQLVWLIVLLYLLAVNLAAFCLFGADKRRARKDAWRVQEKTLFLAALLGGSVGALAGMRVFHHKTRKWDFRWGIPAILLLQLAAAVLSTALAAGWRPVVF